MTAIRQAVPADVPLILEMLRESAAEQSAPDAVVVSEADLLEDGFGAQPQFHALIAKRDNSPAGLALYFFTYSTWVSRIGLYLEDLYVRPEYRRSGVAQALMHELGAIAVNRGCKRFTWSVLKENKRAVRFYEALGARALDEWQLMKLELPPG